MRRTLPARPKNLCQKNLTLKIFLRTCPTVAAGVTYRKTKLHVLVRTSDHRAAKMPPAGRGESACVADKFVSQIIGL